MAHTLLVGDFLAGSIYTNLFRGRCRGGKGLWPSQSIIVERGEVSH
jgi:hypothetical protein